MNKKHLHKSVLGLMAMTVLFFCCSNIGIDGTNSIATVTAITGEVTEGSELVFQINLTQAVYDDVEVNYTVEGYGNNPADTNDFSSGFGEGTVTFLAGRTSAQITLPTVDDTTVEFTEKVSVTLSLPDGTLILGGQQIAFGTIENDAANESDVEVTISRRVASAEEGSPITFDLQLNQAAGFDITVNYSFSGDVDVSDFTDPLDMLGSVVIDAGTTNTNFSVTLIDDAPLADGPEDLTATIDSVTLPAIIGTPSSDTTAVQDI